VTAYRLIAAEKARAPVFLSCRLLGVSRSGYYEWAARAPSDRALADAWLIEKIREIWTEHRTVYGSPRIHADLRLAHGIRVSRKRVQRLMREAGLSGLVARKRGRTTLRVPGVRVADDLVERRFRPTAPNCSGSPTSPTCGPGKAASTSPPSRTPTAAGLSAGAWPITCAPSWSSTHCRWPSPGAGPNPGWSSTPTRAVNS
jgi:hypothetical protein